MVTYRDIGERLTMLLSNGILSSMALSPVSSFHLYIKIGLWILTELTEFSTKRLSWMKRERKTTMSWIR